MADNEILLGHSPDSDDAFMFYALAREKISTGPYKIKHILADIQTLNERAMRNELDITAISIHAYAYIKSHYYLMTSGMSIGDNYGPIVVAREPMTVDDLGDKIIAIPGIMTTAFLALRLAAGDFNYQAAAFDRIMPMVQAGMADAGLIIHEGQMNYEELGFHKVVDLGAWWKQETGLPLPLGANAIKRTLGPRVIDDLSALLRASIQYAFSHFDQAMEYAMKFAHQMDQQQVEAFVGMYVNQQTLDCGQEGRQAIAELLGRAEAQRLIPPTLPVDFV